MKITVLKYYKNLPYTRILLWMPGGSVVENKKELGFAHFSEHFMFKMNVNGVKPAEFVESLGGYINAFTSHDYMAMDITVLNKYVRKTVNYLEQLYKKELDSVDEKDFMEERKVVIEEMFMYDDEPMENLYIELMKKLFPSHPYSQRVIGEEDVLNSGTKKDLSEFFKKKMLANPFLVLTGGFNEKIEMDLPISGYKQTIPKSQEIKKEHFQLTHNQTKDYFIAGWKIFDNNLKNYAILKLMYSILYTIDGAEFFNELVYEKQIFDSINLSILFSTHGLSFIHSAVFSPEKEQKRIKEWLKIWNNYIFTQNEVSMAREVIFSSEHFDSETESSIGESMAKSFVRFGDEWKVEKELFYHLLHLTADDLNDFKLKYLQPKDVVLGISTVKNSKFKFDFSTELKPIKSIEKEKFINLQNNGVKTTAFIRSDSQFISLHLLKRAGVSFENNNKSGLMTLMMETLSTSTKSMDKKEMEKFLDKYGITLSTLNGNNTNGIKLKVRDVFFDEALNLLEDLFENPLKEEDFEKEKRYMLSSLSMKKDNPFALLNEQIRKTLFNGTNYENPSSGTIETISKINFDDIKTAKNKFLSTNHWGIGLSGCLSKEIIDKINSKFIFTPIISKKPEKLLKKTFNNKVIKVKVPGKNQIYLSKIFQIPDIYHPDFEKIKFLEQLLTGQKSVLFTKLREENGLVYSVDMTAMGGLIGGFAGFVAITSPQKTQKVMEKIDESIESLKKGEFSLKYLDETKSAIEFQLAKSFVKNDYHSFNMALEQSLDFPYLQYQKYIDLVKSMTKESIMEFASKIFDDGFWVISE